MLLSLHWWDDVIFSVCYVRSVPFHPLELCVLICRILKWTLFHFTTAVSFVLIIVIHKHIRIHCESKLSTNRRTTQKKHFLSFIKSYSLGESKIIKKNKRGNSTRKAIFPTLFLPLCVESTCHERLWRTESVKTTFLIPFVYFIRKVKLPSAFWMKCSVPSRNWIFGLVNIYGKFYSFPFHLQTFYYHRICLFVWKINKILLWQWYRVCQAAKAFAFDFW